MPGHSRWRWLAFTLWAVLGVLAPPGLAQCGLWQRVHDQNPGQRWHARMVFDVAAGRSIMFGGTDDRGVWDWDGSTWRLNPPSNLINSTPNGAPGFALAYDGVHHRTVLFGGENQSATWEWDGSAWTKLVVPGPQARRYHAMTFDSVRGRVVLFGGVTPGAPGTPLNDTWEWDGATWTQVASGGPSPRHNHSMAFDSARGRTVIFGGSATSNGGLGDTWEWDGSAWTQVSTTGPAPRRESVMAYDSSRGRTVLFGGYVPSLTIFPYTNDTWEWDGITWAQVSTVGPIPRSQACMTFDHVRGKTVLHGGYNRDASLSQATATTWEWDGAVWVQHGPTEPPPRSNHAMAYDSQRHRTVLFGGYGNQSDRSTWEWDGTSWSQVSFTGPTARSGHAMAFDALRNRAVLFGGQINPSSQTFHGDTWEWNGTDWELRSEAGPAPRTGHTMVFDHARGRILLFGGSASISGVTTYYGDTWEWDGTTWMLLAASGPPPRTGHSMAYDSDRQRTVLFSGSAAYTLADTWEWDGSTWTQMASIPDFYARTHAAMAYDPVRGRTMLFGGCCLRSDLWEWDGQVWSLRRSSSPSLGRLNSPMVFDSHRSRLVIFGGYDTSTFLGDTLELPSTPAPPRIDAHPRATTVLAGEAVSLTVLVSGAGPFTYQWYLDYGSAQIIDGPGGAAPGGGVVSGANTGTLTISNVQLSDAGLYRSSEYRCTITNACGAITTNRVKLTVLPLCGSPDFDGDDLPATDRDIEAFFACLAGDCCLTCGTADFNGDGDFATDADIEAFFRVLAGGNC